MLSRRESEKLMKNVRKIDPKINGFGKGNDAKVYNCHQFQGFRNLRKMCKIYAKMVPK